MFNRNYFAYSPLQLIKSKPINKQIYGWGIQSESSKARIKFLWDVNILSKYFEQQGDNDCSSEKNLTEKLPVLMLLLGAYKTTEAFRKR